MDTSTLCVKKAGRKWHKTPNQKWITEMMKAAGETFDGGIPCKKAVYLPYIEENPIKEDDIFFNTFMPGMAHYISKTEKKYRLLPAADKLLDNVFGEERPWAEAWMNAALHMRRLDTAIFCYGKQGIGKSLLAQFMSEAVGDGISFKTVDDVKRFNSDLRKPFIFFEEINSGYTKGKIKATSDTLKELVTARKKRLEEKYKEATYEEIHPHIWINSNPAPLGKTPLYIEEDDRRYTIICNEEAKPLRKIWTEEDFTLWEKGTLKKSLCYYLYNLTPKADPTKCLETSVKKTLQRASAAVFNEGIIEDVSRDTWEKICEAIDGGRQFTATDIAQKLGINIVGVTNKLNGLGYETKAMKINGETRKIFVKSEETLSNDYWANDDDEYLLEVTDDEKLPEEKVTEEKSYQNEKNEKLPAEKKTEKVTAEEKNEKVTEEKSYRGKKLPRKKVTDDEDLDPSDPDDLEELLRDISI